MVGRKFLGFVLFKASAKRGIFPPIPVHRSREFLFGFPVHRSVEEEAVYTARFPVGGVRMGGLGAFAGSTEDFFFRGRTEVLLGVRVYEGDGGTAH